MLKMHFMKCYCLLHCDVYKCQLQVPISVKLDKCLHREHDKEPSHSYREWLSSSRQTEALFVLEQDERPSDSCRARRQRCGCSEALESRL
jgi:hypothetical protein